MKDGAVVDGAVMDGAVTDSAMKDGAVSATAHIPRDESQTQSQREGTDPGPGKRWHAMYIIYYAISRCIISFNGA